MKLRTLSLLATLSLLSCTEVTTVNPDGSRIITKSADPVLVGQALTLAGQVAAAKAGEKTINPDK